MEIERLYITQSHLKSLNYALVGNYASILNLKSQEKMNENWLTAMHFNKRGSRECPSVLG